MTLTGREKVESIILPCCTMHSNHLEEILFTKGDWVEKLYLINKTNKVERIITGENIGPITVPEEYKEWVESLKKKEGVLGEVGLDIEYGGFKEFAKK